MANLPPFSVEEVIKRGYLIIARHPTYSQPNRGNTMYSPQYDCSSFMGTINGIYSVPATPSMVSVYTSHGYQHLKFTGMGNLKKGDVLVWNKGGTSGEGNNGHTAMYIGNGQIMQMSGSGAHVRGFYYTFSNGESWQDVLRNPNRGIYLVKWENR